jgi:hypothetical protein
MKQYGPVAIVFLIFPAEVPAQPFAPQPGSRVSFHVRTPNVSFDLTRVTVFPPTFGTGYGYGPFVPWCSTAYLPWAGYPNPFFLGGYPAYGGIGPLVMPLVVIDTQAPPPTPVPLPPPVPGPGHVMPGELAGRFRPVGPPERNRARLPVLPVPMPPPPPPDPKLEHAAFVQVARQAFSAGEYGRAVDLARQANSVFGEPADADFLLAQALFALGKYPEATATIHRGMTKQPDWPVSGTPLHELYGAHPERLSDQRRQLEDAAAADRSDLRLEFLRAYILWFDRERDGARRLFKQLGGRVTRPDIIDQFLQN